MCSGIINDFATIVTDSRISAAVSDFILPIKHIIIVIIVIKFSPAERSVGSRRLSRVTVSQPAVD